MRVTNNMISDRMVFNMQRSISRFLTLQGQLSTGKRINKPSDDPIGIQRDLIYRTELNKNEQYQENISQAQTWLMSYDSILNDAKNLITNAKDIAISMANGTYDDSARVGAATEVDSMFERLIQLANSELEGKFTFSGYRTDEKAFEASANGVVYKGDTGKMEYQIEPSSRVTVNLIGSDTFLKQLMILGENADLNVGVTANTLLSDLHAGDGIDQATGTFTITDENLGIVSTIDISGATTLQDVLDTINNQLAADGITNLQAVLGDEGNNILLDTTENGLISDNTSLDKLNGGNGIDMQSGKILVTDGAGITVQVDFSGASTIQEIRNAFNTQMADAGYPQVMMSLNAAGTGLQIDDASGSLGLHVEEVSTVSTTATDLGIIGTIDPTLTGNDLNPIVSFAVNDTTGTTATDLGIFGSFTADKTGDDLDPRITLNTNLSDLKNRLGMNLGELVIHQGDISRTIDLSDPTLVTVQDLIDKLNNSGLDITASINTAGTGIQIANNNPNASLIIEEANSTDTTAKDMGLWGSSDIMGSLLLLGKALRDNDQEGTGLLLENFSNSIDHLLNTRASVGARSIRLESTVNRLKDLEISFTKLLSEVEDADITKLVTELATQENNYKASLMASAKIVQPSLLDFLR